MIRIGIICPSEIAYRRFLPALAQLPEYEYVGVAVADAEEWNGGKDVKPEETKAILAKEYKKAESFVKDFGGVIFDGYANMLSSDKIDAVYLPLPPALHYKWAKMALQCGKHVMVEKPSTCSLQDTEELVQLAKEKQLAVHENYMFAYHEQLRALSDMVAQGRIGKVRLYRVSFGFPRRSKGDFRYIKALGGGALLDCGGYTIKYAGMLLGNTARLLYANLNSTSDFDVDIYGSAAYCNDAGDVVQIAFGMDNQYKCELEVWGSTGIIRTGRVLTAPSGFVPKVEIICGNETVTEDLPADDAFRKSLEVMSSCVENQERREQEYQEILQQEARVAAFVDKAADGGLEWERRLP